MRTARHIIHPIVRYDFAKPGATIGDTEEKLSVRCGSTYDRGIYSSRTWYGVLMGRTAGVTRGDNWRNHSEAIDQANSHVANSEYECIVFKEAQIVPCYVLHLDWGAEAARQFLESIPEDSKTWVEAQKKKDVSETGAEGHVRRRRGTRECGEASSCGQVVPVWIRGGAGTRFVIEEIGETSNDENYSEYQEAKIAEETRKRDASVTYKRQNDERNFGRVSIFDEFFEAATTHRKVWSSRTGESG
jgi:hypothetical protein